MRQVDDLVPPAGRRRGQDDLVAAAPERGWLVGLVSAAFRALRWLPPWFRQPAWVDGFVVISLVGLLACAYFADTRPAPWLVSVALYRLAHLTVFQAGVLLRVEGLEVRDRRRTLVLTALNLAEVSFVVAAVFRWRLEYSFGGALLSGFEVVTFRGHSGYAGSWLDLITGLGTAASLVLLVGLLPAVVGSLRDR